MMAPNQTLNNMTELQNIGLIYEATVLLVENPEARLQYLINKYRNAFAKAITDSESDENEDPNYASHYMEYVSQAHRLFSNIVNKADPTHGKYSEWIVVRMIKGFMKNASEADRGGAETLWFNLSNSEDTYKIAEMLDVYDKIKHKLDIQHRDINKLGYYQLRRVVMPFVEEQQELSLKALAKKIKTEESIKLVDNLNGWHVVVPKTKLAARYYGAHTQWCTAAKKDEDNAFDGYNKSGPLIIFIHGETKYQFHVDLAREPGPQGYRPVEFRDEEDGPIKHSNVVPQPVWDATISALKACDGRLKDSAQDVSAWAHGNYVGD